MNFWIQWCRTIFNCLYSHLNDLINDYCKAIICFANVYSSLIFAKRLRCQIPIQSAWTPYSLPLKQLNNSNQRTHFHHIFRNSNVHENGEKLKKPWQVIKGQLDTRELMNTDRYFQRVAQEMKWDSLGFHPLPARINMKSF